MTQDTNTPDPGTPMQPGGFIQHPTPPPDEPLRASGLPPATLPKQRSPPLHQGSRQTSALVSHMDGILLEASRAYHKRFTTVVNGEEVDLDENEEADREVLVKTLKKVLEKMELVLDLVWISGLTSLQTQYLLRITSDLNDYLSGFPPALPPTLHFLSKLDLAFTTLLRSSSLTITDRVRLKSLCERVRLHVVSLAERWEDAGTMEGEEEIEWDVAAAGVFGGVLGIVGGKIGEADEGDVGREAEIKCSPGRERRDSMDGIPNEEDVDTDA